MGFRFMEIATVARRPAGLSPNWRVLAVAAMVLPVTLFAIVPAALGLDRYTITGTSMDGTLDRGSVVFERHVPIGELRADDVITFAPPPGYGARGLVTHRVVSVDADGIVTKGDANLSADPWKLAPTAQSRVELAVPYVGLPFLGGVGRGVWLLIVVAALGLFVAAGLLRDAMSMVRERSSLDSVARSGPG